MKKSVSALTCFIFFINFGKCYAFFNLFGKFRRNETAIKEQQIMKNKLKKEKIKKYLILNKKRQNISNEINKMAPRKIELGKEHFRIFYECNKMQKQDAKIVAELQLLMDREYILIDEITPIIDEMEELKKEIDRL